MPGLICTHSHIGGIGGADSSGPIQPGVRILDSLNVRDSGFKRALAGGLTTLNVMPGSGHLISGQTVYLKLRYGGAASQEDRRPVHSQRSRQAQRRPEDGQWHQLDARRRFRARAAKVLFWCASSSSKPASTSTKSIRPRGTRTRCRRGT